MATKKQKHQVKTKFTKGLKHFPVNSLYHTVLPHSVLLLFNGKSKWRQQRDFQGAFKWSSATLAWMIKMSLCRHTFVIMVYQTAVYLWQSSADSKCLIIWIFLEGLKQIALLKNQTNPSKKHNYWTIWKEIPIEKSQQNLFLFIFFFKCIFF